jgi:hypothetical protein
MMMMRDLDLVKVDFIRDFWHLNDVGFIPEGLEEIEGNNLGLFTTKGQEWKSLRYRISPAFSITHLKDVAMHAGNQLCVCVCVCV